MHWFLSLIVGVLSAALGLLVAGVIASACVKWYRVSSFEGGSGYMVVFTALVGGVVGLVVGVVVSRMAGGADAAGFFRGLGLSCAAIGGLGGLATLLSWGLADIPPTLGGQTLDLIVEVKLPVGEAPPTSVSEDDTYVELGSLAGHTQRASKRGEVALGDARLVDGRWVVSGSVPLFTARGKRVVEMMIGGKNFAGFLIPLPARPGASFETWSDWMPKPRGGSPAWPDSKSSIRFRVRLESDRPATATAITEVMNSGNPQS